MLQIRRQALPRCIRLYSTPSAKPSLKLVAELRKSTEVTIVKAREALSASNNDVAAALKWLQQDLVSSGAVKAAKVAGRATPEGMVSVCVLSPGSGSSHGGVRAAMIELNCETDFVGRNEVFGRLAANIAHTAAFLSEPAHTGRHFIPFELEALNDAPLLSPTDTESRHSVADSIREAISKLGEKISLRRAVAVVQEPNLSESGLRVASYSHGAVNIPTNGRVGTLALLALKSPQLPSLLVDASFSKDMSNLERALARQIVGFDTRMIEPTSPEDEEHALYSQTFAMHVDNTDGELVRAFLKNWAQKRNLEGGVSVLDFAKWTVNGDLD